MGTVIKELVQRGHDQAAELKSSCGAIDVRSVAQLISDLASHLDVQLARSNALAAENAHARERHVFIRALAVSILEHSGGRMDWRGAMEDATELLQTVDSVYAKTPATDAFLAEVRAQGVEMFADKYRAQLTALPTTSENIFDAAHVSLRYQIFDADEFAARLRKGVAQ
ncbi:hypothetical protein LRT86_003551 [Salmonella enterica]|uniref:hypothetical protein n=1 Tax=Salmonella enterica TaxID=28901 RepID=UPI001874F937|nr:hypothetical protein [Salmonella enterica]EIP7415215.1 hypothetical protein [Salmonella enterica]